MPSIYGLTKEGKYTRCRAKDPHNCRYHIQHKEMNGTQARDYNTMEHIQPLTAHDMSNALKATRSTVIPPHDNTTSLAQALRSPYLENALEYHNSEAEAVFVQENGSHPYFPRMSDEQAQQLRNTFEQLTTREHYHGEEPMDGEFVLTPIEEYSLTALVSNKNAYDTQVRSMLQDSQVVLPLGSETLIMHSPYATDKDMDDLYKNHPYSALSYQGLKGEYVHESLSTIQDKYKDISHVMIPHNDIDTASLAFSHANANTQDIVDTYHALLDSQGLARSDSDILLHSVACNPNPRTARDVLETMKRDSRMSRPDYQRAISQLRVAIETV